MAKKCFNVSRYLNEECSMKKNFLILSIAMVLFGGVAFAEGMVFDPTEYQVTVEKTRTLPSNSNIEASTKASQF